MMKTIVLNDRYVTVRNRGEACLHLRHMALDNDGKTRVFLEVDGNGEEMLLGTLTARMPQVMLDLPVVGEVFRFRMVGNGKVYLVGMVDEDGLDIRTHKERRYDHGDEQDEGEDEADDVSEEESESQSPERDTRSKKPIIPKDDSKKKSDGTLDLRKRRGGNNPGGRNGRHKNKTYK